MKHACIHTSTSTFQPSSRTNSSSSHLLSYLYSDLVSFFFSTSFSLHNTTHTYHFPLFSSRFFLLLFFLLCLRFTHRHVPHDLQTLRFQISERTFLHFFSRKKKHKSIFLTKSGAYISPVISRATTFWCSDFWGRGGVVIMRWCVFGFFFNSYFISFFFSVLQPLSTLCLANVHVCMCASFLLFFFFFFLFFSLLDSSPIVYATPPIS